MKVYLNDSVYNRPFDDQGQPRIELEAMNEEIKRFQEQQEGQAKS
jgi:hypothetical protein